MAVCIVGRTSERDTTKQRNEHTDSNDDQHVKQRGSSSADGQMHEIATVVERDDASEKGECGFRSIGVLGATIAAAVLACCSACMPIVLFVFRAVIAASWLDALPLLSGSAVPGRRLSINQVDGCGWIRRATETGMRRLLLSEWSM